MLFSNIISRAGNRGGFSLGEVIIATALFMTAVVGVGGMLVAGTAGVSRSAQANKAQRLAMEKIEEVKNLPFYTSWEESGQNTDIDDFYYDYVYANDQQFAHPTEENPVSGYVGYRRTTAVQYVYAGASKLEYATMDPGWRPNYPAPPATFDKPKGGPAGGPYEYLHGIMIEVRVYYMVEGVEKSLVQHALAGDLITPGGESGLNPILIVEKIVPNVGYIGDSSLDCTISVTAPDLEVGDDVNVALWRGGTSEEIVATNVVVVSNTTITCRFNLMTPVPDADTYNLSVYWVDRGFKDDNLRGCFEVQVIPPTISDVYTTGDSPSTAWGYEGQTARTIYITGSNLAECSVSLVKVGQSSIAGSGYAYNGDATLAWANFNLTTAVTGNWDIEMSNAAGGDTANNCFVQNPQVTVSSINQGGSYFSWGYRDLTGSRRVQINGAYLYGLNSAPGTSDLTRAGLPDCDATAYVYAASGNGISSSDCSYARVDYDLSGTPAERPNNTKWKVFVTNGGNRTASMDGVWDGVGPDYGFQMNPPPQITGFSGLGNVHTGTANSPDNLVSSIGVTGKYLQNGTNVYVYTGVELTNVHLGGVNVAADGTSITGMTMRTNVNPMTSSFTIWGGGVQSDNTKIGGAYNVYVWPPDDQAVIAPATFTVNHAQYTISATSSPAGWGSVTGTGSKWQDESYSLSPSPVSSSGNYLGALRAWQEPPGTDQWGYPYTITGEATANRSLNCRFSKWFYHGGYGGSANFAGFSNGKWNSACETNYFYNDGGTCMRLHAWGTAGLFSSNSGEVSGATANKVSFTGATTLWIYWRQTNGTICNEYWTLNVSGGRGDGYGSGQRIFHQGAGGWRWENTNVSGAASNYIHVNAYAQGSAPYLNGNSDTRVRYVFME